MILKVGVDSLQKVESEFTKIIDSNVGRDEKFRKLFSLMAEGHVETQSMMKEEFVGLCNFLKMVIPIFLQPIIRRNHYHEKPLPI